MDSKINHPIDKTLWIVLFIILATFLIYRPVFNYDFVNFDDDGYVYNNDQVKKGLSISGFDYAFTTTDKGNYIPLTWLSYMSDIEIFGFTPGGLHFSNLFLHIFNSLLLFFFLKINTGRLWLSFIVAMLFAIHPLHVESVAWISERKDVLSTFLGLSALIFYCKYVRQRTLKNYCLTLLFFLSSLLSKPMLVTLPVIFFLIDFWPLHRVSSLLDFFRFRITRILIIEKIPFFILSIIFSAIAVLSQKSADAMPPLSAISFLTRVMNAPISYAGYIYKMLWPFKLAVIYPYQHHIEILSVALSVLLVSIISGFAIFYNKKYPYLLVGWLWFLITLLPVIGLIQVGPQSMADRYTYIPLIGLFIAAVWVFYDLIIKFRVNQKIMVTATAGLIVTFSMITMNQLTTWQNSITLFKHALSVTQNNWIAHLNFAAALSNEGQIDESIYHYHQALKISKNIPTAWFNLGNAYSSKQMFDQALSHYRTALELKPDYADAYCGIGALMGRKGDLKMAIKAYEKALAINPNLNSALKNKKYAEKLLETGQR